MRLPGVPPTRRRCVEEILYLQSKNGVCKKIWRGGQEGSWRPMSKHSFIFYLSLFALFWVNVRLCWELAGTAYYKNLNLKHLAPSMPKYIKNKIWKISCSQICMPRCKCLFLQLSLCHDSLHDHEQGRGCCPVPNLQLQQSLVSCTMKWIITTAAWKNIIWPAPSYSPMGTDLWSRLKIDRAFNQQCSFRLSGHPAERLEGYKRSIEIN